MVTPAMRCSTSVTDLSGNLPISSATIESTISSEFFFDFLRRFQRGTLTGHDHSRRGFATSAIVVGRPRSLRQCGTACQQGQLRHTDSDRRSFDIFIQLIVSMFFRKFATMQNREYPPRHVRRTTRIGGACALALLMHGPLKVTCSARRGALPGYVRRLPCRVPKSAWHVAAKRGKKWIGDPGQRPHWIDNSSPFDCPACCGALSEVAACGHKIEIAYSVGGTVGRQL
jgi:hypothetical protein